MRRRLLTISAIRLGEMPMALASWFCDKPYSARNSSFSISPGVTGANSFATIHRLLSVVVNDSYLMWLTVDPFEDHAPLIVDADRVEILQVSLQLLEPIRWRDHQVLQPARRVDRLELALGRT